MFLVVLNNFPVITKTKSKNQTMRVDPKLVLYEMKELQNKSGYIGYPTFTCISARQCMLRAITQHYVTS